MGNENKMGARTKAEQIAKARAAAARVNAARDAAIAKTKAAAAGSQQAAKTAGQAAMAGVGGSKPVAAAMSAMGTGPVAGSAIIAEYTVKKGDTISQIAMNFYGVTNAKIWKLIQDANKGLVKNADLISPGQVLKIPALPVDLKK